MKRPLSFHLNEFAEGTTELLLELTAAELEIGSASEPRAMEFAVVGPIAISLRFVRTREEFRVCGRGELVVRQACVRCLADVEVPLEAAIDILVRPRDARSPEDESLPDAVIIHDGEGFSLGADLRDAILVEISSHPLCRPDCRGLCPRCGRDRNDGRCDCPPGEGVDSRWAQLMKLPRQHPESEEPGNSQT